MNWFHLLTVILVIAKIAGFVTFSWWLVFLPSIISLSIAVLLVMFVSIVAIVWGD